MIKKIIIFFFIIMLTHQHVWAYNSNDLNIDFFNHFNDNCLTYYINSTLENNHDLKKTEHIIEEYRQQVKYSFAQELPSFSVSANYL